MKYNLFSKLNSYVPLFIRRNFGRKVIAIFFAILVYVKVSSQLGEEKVLQRIPINIVAHGNIDVMNYQPNTVNVTIRGSKRKVSLLSSSDIRIEIPITERTLKQHNYKLNQSFSMNINERWMHIPSGLSLIRVTPNDLTIHCDRRTSKTVPIIPVFRGSPPMDYERGEVTIIPQTVTLTGPETILKDINSISTEPIYLDKTTVDDFLVDSKVQSVDRKILASPSLAQVGVEIYKAIGTNVFDDIPVDILFGKQNAKFYAKLKLSSNTVNVTLRGPKSHLEMLTDSQIKTFVDISNFNKPGIYQVKVDCWVNDPKVSVKFIEPSILNVELLKVPPT